MFPYHEFHHRNIWCFARWITLIKESFFLLLIVQRPLLCMARALFAKAVAPDSFVRARARAAKTRNCELSLRSFIRVGHEKLFQLNWFISSKIMIFILKQVVRGESKLNRFFESSLPNTYDTCTVLQNLYLKSLSFLSFLSRNLKNTVKWYILTFHSNIFLNQ